MTITKERVLIDKGREILTNLLPDVEKTPGYLGWKIVETADFLPRRGEDVEIRAIFLLVKIDGDANAHEVTDYIESIEEKAYATFADLTLEDELEGKVNIFILMDLEE